MASIENSAMYSIDYIRVCRQLFLSGGTSLP